MASPCEPTPPTKGVWEEKPWSLGISRFHQASLAGTQQVRAAPTEKLLDMQLMQLNVAIGAFLQPFPTVQTKSANNLQ